MKYTFIIFCLSFFLILLLLPPPLLFVLFCFVALRSSIYVLSQCRYFNIAADLLPEICSSSEIYGHITEDPLKGIPISAVSFIHSVDADLCKVTKAVT
jgi:hypothetical protein